MNRRKRAWAMSGVALGIGFIASGVLTPLGVAVAVVVIFCGIGYLCLSKRGAR